MWLTSNKPTLVRTAMCSAISPPPSPGYSTGISQPPKSTILAFNARWAAFKAVFFSGEATGELKSGWTGSGMGSSFQRCCRTLITIETHRLRGQTRRCGVRPRSPPAEFRLPFPAQKAQGSPQRMQPGLPSLQTPSIAGVISDKSTMACERLKNQSLPAKPQFFTNPNPVFLMVSDFP